MVYTITSPTESDTADLLDRVPTYVAHGKKLDEHDALDFSRNSVLAKLYALAFEADHGSYKMQSFHFVRENESSGEGRTRPCTFS